MLKNKKIISIFELVIILISVFSFSYFFSTNLPDVFEKENSVIKFLARPIFPSVLALGDMPSGCCKETISGAKCQDVLVTDKDICKTDLIGTSCQVVSECQRGCCYDSDSGICAFNAPKESCLTNGGKWSESKTCEISECQVGCCLVGTGAIIATTRECTKLSNVFDFAKKFQPLDTKGSCDIYTELKEEGACLTASDDFSDLKNCVFTTKENCNRNGQEFLKGYLCTSKELNSTCEKTEKTTCFNDKVYFVDGCGNRANIYDSSKGKNQAYWEKIVSPSESCSGSASSCGNCDYSDGSICTKYVSGKGFEKPNMGNYVCRNLDCEGGKKHGESWCISDAVDANQVGSPVGTRNYVATCFEGDIRLEGCADFNQEICIENKDSVSKKSDAMCVINDWRSCIYANDASSYLEVKKKCEELPQCVMFNDISGNEKYKDLPGFKEISNNDQGRAGKVGDGMNEIITHCVPRFTPGFQFWNTASSVSFGDKVSSGSSYGGSISETNSICNIASFTCISHIETTSSIAGGSSSVDKENPECNWQAVSQDKQQVALMMDALNDRCRSLGSCGLQYNVQGELGRSGFSTNRIYVDKGGKSHEGYTTEGYNVTDEYLKDTKKEQSANKISSIKKLEDLGKWRNGASLLTAFGSSIGKSGSMISGAFGGKTMIGGGEDASGLVGAVGGLAGVGMMVGIGGIAAGTAIPMGTSLAAGSQIVVGEQTLIVGNTAPLATQGAVAGPSGATTSAGGAVSGALTTIAVAAAAFIVGSYIGKLMSKGQPPGEAAVTTALWAGAATAATMAVTGIVNLLGFGTLCLGPQAILCAVIAIAAIIYAVFTEGTDHEYYVTEFKCEAWQPPLIGKCEECNNDVRPCTEYKCRSMGNNCQYFVENGEPGYCATITDVWQAKISPWEEVLTENNKYSNVSSFGFKIENKNNKDSTVNAWEQVSFGITTDKDAICKIDIERNRSFEEMRYVMESSVNYDIGRNDGKHHRIVLSPHAIIGNNNENVATTVPLDEGDNEYYIVCQNFAGIVNDAPFVIKVRQADGYDLTAPLITRISPENNAYLAKDKTNLELFLYLNEPAECRYSFEPISSMPSSSLNQDDIISITQEQEQDVTVEEYLKPQTTEIINDGSIPLTCVTSPTMGYYGEWMCAAFVPNYTANKKLYIECKDQPGLMESGLNRRNSAKQEYSAQICETGLEINSITPVGRIETSANSSIGLRVITSGCINGGDANCQYRLPFYGNSYSFMLNTGNKTHTQPFTSLGSGERYVEVVCEDKAGNVAEANTSFTVFIDDEAPKITRVFINGDSLIIKTDENAECLFNTNQTVGCDFKLENTRGQYNTEHEIKIKEYASNEYFIKCVDEKGNAPLGGCTTRLKLSEIK